MYVEPSDVVKDKGALVYWSLNPVTRKRPPNALPLKVKVRVSVLFTDEICPNGVPVESPVEEMPHRLSVIELFVIETQFSVMLVTPRSPAANEL